MDKTAADEVSFRARNLVPFLLEDLGETDDAIAASLKKEGCKGLPGDPCECPLAVYLTSKLTGLRAEVYMSCIAVYESDMNFSLARIPLGTAVSRFASRFDSGRYPDLLKELPEGDILPF